MPDLGNRRVLIAEPDAALADGLDAVIGAWTGRRCTVVRSPQALRAALSATACDMAVVNVDLAGGLAGVRSLARRHRIATVAIASSWEPTAANGAENLPCLEMPFPVTELHAALQRAAAQDPKGLSPSRILEPSCAPPTA